MNRYVKVLIFVLLLTMLASGCSNQASKPFTQIIAFGDDWTDNGNAFRYTLKDVQNNIPESAILPPSSLYWEGRWSNGPVAVEIMAQRLQAKLTDYAVSGAMSNTRSGFDTQLYGGEYEVTGLQSQVTQFESELNGKKADPDALYFVFTSMGNDFWMFMDEGGSSGSCADFADEVLKNLQTAVTELSQLGAKRFMVVNTFDWTIMPFFAANKIEGLEIFQSRYQSKLKKKMTDLSKQLNIEMNVFDMQAISDKIRSDPQKYSLKNLTDPCMADYWAYTACENPDEYYFWDPFHQTRRVHQIFGEAMAAVYGK